MHQGQIPHTNHCRAGGGGVDNGKIYALSVPRARPGPCLRTVLGKWYCFVVMDTRKSLGGGCLDEEMTVVVWGFGSSGDRAGPHAKTKNELAHQGLKHKHLGSHDK